MIQQHSISRGRGGGGATEIWARGHIMKGPPAWSSGGSLDRDPLGGLRNYPLLSTTSVNFNRNAFLIHYLLTALKEAAQPSLLTLTRISIWKLTSMKQTIHFLWTGIRTGAIVFIESHWSLNISLRTLGSVETVVVTELFMVL